MMTRRGNARTVKTTTGKTTTELLINSLALFSLPVSFSLSISSLSLSSLSLSAKTEGSQDHKRGHTRTSDKKNNDQVKRPEGTRRVMPRTKSTRRQPCQNGPTPPHNQLNPFAPFVSEGARMRAYGGERARSSERARESERQSGEREKARDKESWKERGRERERERARGRERARERDPRDEVLLPGREITGGGP